MRPLGTMRQERTEARRRQEVARYRVRWTRNTVAYCARRYGKWRVKDGVIERHVGQNREERRQDDRRDRRTWGGGKRAKQAASAWVRALIGVSPSVSEMRWLNSKAGRP